MLFLELSVIAIYFLFNNGDHWFGGFKDEDIEKDFNLFAFDPIFWFVTLPFLTELWLLLLCEAGV